MTWGQALYGIIACGISLLAGQLQMYLKYKKILEEAEQKHEIEIERVKVAEWNQGYNDRCAQERERRGR